MFQLKGCEIMSNLEEKRKRDWYDQEKVNNMSFDDSEWRETCKILDDPNIDQTTKDKALDDYINLLFHQMGVKGY